MKIFLRAGGVIRTGAERDLIDDYIKRANGLARGTGFTSIEEQQIDLRRAKSRAEETQVLFQGIPENAIIIILDERGKALTSRKISNQLIDWRSDGNSSVIIMIGGADGFEPANIPTGVIKWSFGHQTWPHKMVRVMASEQIYRALSIIAGTPYHRD